MGLQSFNGLATTRDAVKGEGSLDSVLVEPTEIKSLNQVRFSPYFKGSFDYQEEPIPSNAVNCYLGRDMGRLNRLAEGRFLLLVRTIKDLNEYVELPSKPFKDVLQAAQESGLDPLCVMSFQYVNVFDFPVDPNVVYEIVHPVRRGAKFLFVQNLLLRFPDADTFYDLNWNQLKKRWRALS